VGRRCNQVGPTISNPLSPLIVRKIDDVNGKGPEHLGNVYEVYRRVAGDALANNDGGKKQGMLTGPSRIR
jgi:hypothetical protein